MTPLQNSGRIVVDAAGAVMGGAARYLDELRRYLLAESRSDVDVLGTSRRLDSGWLLRREVEARGAIRRIALNNACFATGFSRTVLLGNALHFADPAELSGLNYSLPPSIRLQAIVVRRLAERAKTIVVPSTAMAERVTRYLPWLEHRINVRFHPVSAVPIQATSTARPQVLIPILPAPYKNLDRHVQRLLAANASIDVVVTGTPSEFPSLKLGLDRVRFLGRLSSSSLQAHWTSSSAIYFPTQLESFGYPLAEARASGVSVIALDTQQNREIAGPALRGFRFGDRNSLCVAVEEALGHRPAPDPTPFHPRTYFDWLLDGQL